MIFVLVDLHTTPWSFLHNTQVRIDTDASNSGVLLRQHDIHESFPKDHPPFVQK
jgi:hypothetical protein